MVGAAYVESLATAKADAARLGGKGASLASLIGLGHRVPPGLVITVDAFVATIDALGLSGPMAELEAWMATDDPLPQAAEAVTRELAEGSVPPHVLGEVIRQVQELGLWRDNRDGIIVRSSATVEDSAVHSFAGIFESIPITSPEQLEPTIREVWSSVFAPRALTYARDCGLRTVPTMALVVQRFLEAERSGVMFTTFAGPDGNPRTLVEHVEGTCEKLVKGEVTPDRLWLEGVGSVPDDLAGLLAPRHARELARLAADLEASFGGPQDVEWCIYGDAVHLVQSRPVTASFAGGGGTAQGLEGVTPVLTGVPASPGAGSGEVHLVFNIEQALRLQTGQVLVTPMTNPDMVVAMRNSAAIVTDVGGMICHAAIVSRELGLPCVVGTETATRTLEAGAPVTVDGSSGAVYLGIHHIERGQARRPAEWADLWAAWGQAAGRTGAVPVVSSVAALEHAPEGSPVAVLVPDPDLRADRYGLWNDLEGMPAADRDRALDDYLGRVSGAASDRNLSAVLLLASGNLSPDDLAAALERAGDPRVRRFDPSASDGPLLLLDPEDGWSSAGGRSPAVPLGAAVAGHSGSADPRRALTGMDEAKLAAHDTLKFFGHTPGVKFTTMPDTSWRRGWWAVLPEYARYHQEFGTEHEHGEFDWLEVRPELVISSLLKSLVQPGFEMVPRIMGFRDLPPMHIKWIKCRYHFRADTFARVWAAIVDATWDASYMADLMRRVRASYEALREVLALFPDTDDQIRDLSGARIVALITSWWPRWVEFFSLCWFIQAQGDDVLYPFIEETVGANLAALGEPPGEFAWPPPTDLIAPTTPVMSGEYMASVGRLRELLVGAGLATKEDAVAALGRREQPELADRLDEHLRMWGWMRDRDLLFEPWDTPGRVIETALRTEPHAPSPYAENLRRNLLALSFHQDLAHASGRAEGLNHAVRFLHDLNVERENHHILWLKYSYPLRRVVLEVERRLVEAGSLAPGDIFFTQAPELIAAAGRLPEPLPEGVVARVKNRRRGFENEARLAPEGSPPAEDEDDYY